MPTIDPVQAGAASVLAAGAASVLAQVIQAVRHRGQDRQHEDALVVGTARELVQMLREELHEQEERHRTEIGRVRQELDDARAELQAARDEIAQLKRDLATAAGSPPPAPHPAPEQ